ncbi:glmZ(sRNA)-inactivating NTPase [Achromatium sp. WMS2]|nr:glmZ(sRNA)-inactivating NTPase [Achromatium sp. WMS2]
MQLTIVTGLAGSGKSTALHTLEDLGYNCIDNLPIFLLQELASRIATKQDPEFARMAVGIDARSSRDQLTNLPQIVTALKAQDINCTILFLDAQTEKLTQRFSETKRKHPLATSQFSLTEAMQLERQLMEPILCIANLHIDTTYTNIYQLRDLIRQRLNNPTPKLSILIKSFGYKHGIPRDADFVFDVRCLPNPHWQPDLRHLTGKDLAVIDFLDSCVQVKSMLADIINFFDNWITEFQADGRNYLTIAIGCTGGQHRSVYIAETLKQHLEQYDCNLLIRHRELPA